MSHLNSPLHDKETIQQWVQQARAGDEMAFTRLVETFGGRLQSMIYRMLLDWDETRDVAQETFIHAYRALSRYRPSGRFQSWLFQIGARQALDALRKRKRRFEHFQGTNKKEEEIGKEDSTVARNEIVRAIEEAVQELPAEQRIAFVMAEYEGCSYQEIASVIGGSSKRVEMHLYRARFTLRARLKLYLS